VLPAADFCREVKAPKEGIAASAAVIDAVNQRGLAFVGKERGGVQQPL